MNTFTSMVKFKCDLCNKEYITVGTPKYYKWTVKSPSRTAIFFVCAICENPNHTAWVTDWYKVKNVIQRLFKIDAKL